MPTASTEFKTILATGSNSIRSVTPSSTFVPVLETNQIVSLTMTAVQNRAMRTAITTATPILKLSITSTLTYIPDATLLPAWSSRIDQLSNNYLTNTGLVGLAVGVSRGSSASYSQGFGYASMENSLPVQADTIFEIGSLTKQFTAAAILQLAEQGKLELDAPVSTYVPNLPYSVQPTTIRQLLSHTGGIFDPDLDPDFASRRILSTQDIVNYYISITDGSYWRGNFYLYSNAGYWLLGLVIEAISGEDYGSYLRSHIFEPLEMERTSYCSDAVPFERPPGLAQGYRLRNNGYEFYNANMSLVYAAGGLCSTAGDLLIWLQELSEGKVIGPDLFKQMVTPVILPNGSNTYHGYGVFISTKPGDAYFTHSGFVESFQSYLIHYLDKDLDIVVLSNTGVYGWDFTYFAQEIRREVLR